MEQKSNAKIGSEPADLRQLLGKYWKLVVGLTVAFALAAVAFVVLSAPKWKGVTTLLVVSPDAARGTSQLAVLSQTVATPLRTIKGVVLSKRETEAIIKKFNLDWKKFDANFKATDESQTNQLIIEYTDTNKDQVTEVLHFAIEKLSELDESLSFTTGKRQAATLKTAVDSKSSEVEKAEASLLAFQKKMKTLSDPQNPKSTGAYLERLQSLEFELGSTKIQSEKLREQLNASAKNNLVPADVPGGKEWIAKISVLENELAVLRKKYTDEYPEVVQARRVLNAARDSFREIVEKYLKTINQGLDPKLAELQAKQVLLEYQVQSARGLAAIAPDEALELSRKVSEVMTLRSVLATLRAQYEQARVDSEVGRVRWNVLDYPYIERIPVNKSFRVPVLLAIVLGLGVSLMVASSLDKRRK